LKEQKKSKKRPLSPNTDSDSEKYFPKVISTDTCNDDDSFDGHGSEGHCSHHDGEEFGPKMETEFNYD